jgi:hypothetical protein
MATHYLFGWFHYHRDPISTEYMIPPAWQTIQGCPVGSDTKLRQDLA